MTFVWCESNNNESVCYAHWLYWCGTRQYKTKRISVCKSEVEVEQDSGRQLCFECGTRSTQIGGITSPNCVRGCYVNAGSKCTKVLQRRLRLTSGVITLEP